MDYNPYSAIGSAVGGIASAFGARKANKRNIALARDQMAFQERMANTAHQRQVKDLRKAGLNPVLSVTGPSGAATPSGQTTTTQDAVSPAIGSALQAMSALKQIEKTDAETKNIQTDTRVKGGKAATGEITGDVIGGIGDMLLGEPDSASAKKLKQQAKRAKKNIDAIRSKNKRKERSHWQREKQEFKKGYENLKKKIFNYFK